MLKPNLQKQAMKILIYSYNTGTAMSILLNCLLGGENKQTFSARNWQRKRDGKLHLVPIIDILFGSDHCMISWIEYEYRQIDKGM